MQSTRTDCDYRNSENNLQLRLQKQNCVETALGHRKRRPIKPLEAAMTERSVSYRVSSNTYENLQNVFFLSAPPDGISLHRLFRIRSRIRWYDVALAPRGSRDLFRLLFESSRGSTVRLGDISCFIRTFPDEKAFRFFNCDFLVSWKNRISPLQKIA